MNKKPESTTITEWGYRLEGSGVEEWQGEYGRDGFYIDKNDEYGVGVIGINSDADAPDSIRAALSRAGVDGEALYRTITTTYGETQTL